MNLSRFDLNLLVVFDALVQERSVTKVGARIGLSQPAVSHALNKLRHLLKDELFERGEGGMRPTPRALALAGPVRQTLNQLQAALAPQVFDPASATDAFNVAIYNYASTVIMAPLAKRLRSQAPSVSLHMHTTDAIDFFDALETGALDLVIGPVRDIPAGFVTEELVVDTYCGLARDNHPLFNAPMTVDALRRLPCVGIGPRRQATSAVGEALARKGVELHTVMTVQHLFAASEVLRQTDLVSFVLRRVTTRHAAIYSGLDGLRPFELPVVLDPVPCQMIWHRYLTAQPAHGWLRKQIAECFTEAM
jgi:DNA-binding transcriptional LysR family regulator